MSDDVAKDEAPEAEAKSPEKASTPKPAKDGEKKKSPLGTAIFLLGFVATLGVGYLGGQQIRDYFRDPIDLEQGERYDVKLRGDEPQLGPDDALVTIVEFSDFQCPYCSKAVGPLKKMVDKYDGDVRVIFKHYPLPFHPKAAPAAYTAWAAHQQGAFWEFHDWLFEHGGDIRTLPDKIKELGLDADKFGDDMESQAAKDSVDDDHLSGGRVGVTGTPAFLVNGHPYSGARDDFFWKQVIEAELEHAEGVVDGGVARADFYKTLMAEAEKTRGGGGGGVGGAPSERKSQRRAGEPFAEHTYAVPTDGRPQQGPDDALVTIVEFADFDCPFCRKVIPTLDEVKDKYGDDVRVVYRQLPLEMHKRARPASIAALAAGRQGKYWEMHEELYKRKNVRDLDAFVALAEELGLDTEQFKQDFGDPELEDEIEHDKKVARQFGIRGTPAFFVNGRFISGAQPLTAFSSLIDEELKRAEKRLEAGTARDEVYAAILREGQDEVKE